MLAVVLVLVIASPALAFPDVPASHPYYDAITGMADQAIIGGYTNGNFGPEDLVIRQQFAKMVVLTLDLPVTEDDWQDATRPFLDLNPDDPAKLYPHEYVAVCARNNITKGTKDPTKFAPYDNITRQQVITMVVRAADNLAPGILEAVPTGWNGVLSYSDPTHGANIKKAEYNGLLSGIRASLAAPGLTGWNSGANANRGEVAQILWNLLNLLTPSGVWVYVDGSGDYPTIEAAVDDIDPGTTIHLGPGIFNLTKTILVDFSFNLVGSGMEGPTGSTVRYAGGVVDVHSVSFSADDIRFECTATNKAANVMDVGDATVDLLRCYFAGGNRSSDQRGNGLYLYGTGEATVTDCVFALNDLHGVELVDEAYATITNSTMSDNGSNGIGLFDGSSAVVDLCDCVGNGLHGVSVNDSAEVTVRNSECSHNGDAGDYASGIYLEEDTVGTIQNCVCNYNLIDGISTHDNAQLTLADNTCNYNGEDGITFSEHVTGTITNCECSYNSGYDGIDVHDDSYAVVENNVCLHNFEAGIWFGDNASGSVSNNECAFNHYGLLVDSSANPTIGTNNLHDNTQNYRVD